MNATLPPYSVKMLVDGTEVANFKAINVECYCDYNGAKWFTAGLFSAKESENVALLIKHPTEYEYTLNIITGVHSYE